MNFDVVIGVQGHTTREFHVRDAESANAVRRFVTGSLRRDDHFCVYVNVPEQSVSELSRRTQGLRWVCTAGYLGATTFIGDDAMFLCMNSTSFFSE